MPLRSRPLFLVPSMMERPEVEAVWLDVKDGLTPASMDGPVVDAARLLLARLEPLIVEANVAGYEIVSIVASAGPNGAAPCMFVSLETFLVSPGLESWDALVGVPVTWASAKGALALRVLPRLATREAVGSEGSTIASSYGIEFALPPPWIGGVDRNAGGWAVLTTSATPALPGAIAEIAGDAAKAGTPARALLTAIRTPAGAAWAAHGGQPAQLQHCALAPLFDPGAWRFPADDVDLRVIAPRIRGDLWRGGRPEYADLVDLTLEELLRRVVASSDSRVLEDIRAGLRSELLRRSLVDPDVIPAAGLTDVDLGPRVLALFAEVEGFGRRRLPLDLFLLLELGLVSLGRRVPEEEDLPAVVSREWTVPCVTGRYDLVVTPAPIDVEALGVEATAAAIHARVAAESLSAGLNQAGEHLEGFLQTRGFDTAPDPPLRPGPATFVTWTITAERDHGFAGTRFRGTMSAAGLSTDCVLTFVPTADGLRLTLAYQGSEKTLLRPASLARVLSRGEDQATVPLSEPIKPFMSDAELAAFGRPREVIEAHERYWPSAAETALLERIVERLVLDMEDVAAGSEAVRSFRMSLLCEKLSAAFAYFYRKAPDGTGMPGKQVALARAFVRDRLVAMPGDNSAFDEWSSPDAPPRTYWQALALAAGWAESDCRPIEDRLGLGVRPINALMLAEDTVDHVYSYRIRTDGAVLGMIGDIPLGAGGDVLMETPVGKAFEKFVSKGVQALTKLDGANYGLTPDVQLDAISADFKKLRPYPPASSGMPEPHGWPGTQANPGIVKYVGGLIGGGAAFAAGINLDYETDWSDINTGTDPWTPQDFAGLMVSGGFTAGWTGFGIEGLAEPAFGWLYGHFLDGVSADNFRAMGEYTYTQFLAPDPPPEREDASSWSFTFIDSWGLWIGVTLTGTVGYLWLGEDPKLVDPSVLVAPGALTGQMTADSGVSFDVGRSELTASGMALLRRTAARHLRSLATPSTSLLVAGHASPDDARALYNQTLSERRAANVVRYLRSYLGPLFAVPPGRTACRGHGDLQAREDGGPPESWRRVDVTINGRIAVRMTAL